MREVLKRAQETAIKMKQEGEAKKVKESEQCDVSP